MQGVSVLLNALGEMGVDLKALALAWARLLPTLVLVPAFGAKVLPRASVTVLGLGLGLVMAPSLAVSLQSERVGSGAEFVVLLLGQVAAGLPLALSSSALLWAAMMAGGLIDDLRGAGASSASIFTEASTPIGTLFGLFVAFAFLQLGGADHLLGGLVALPPRGSGMGAQVLLPVVARLVSALGIALALATPILTAVIVWEVAAALIARAATPAHVQSVVAPLRAMVLLSVLALSLDGMFGFLEQAILR